MVLACLIAAVGIILDSADPDHRRDGRRARVRADRRPLRRRGAATAGRRPALVRARSRSASRSGSPPPSCSRSRSAAVDLTPTDFRSRTIRSPTSSPTPTRSRSSSRCSPAWPGVLSLTTAKSGALVGVLISVTTIPAAANIGVAAAYAEWPRMGRRDGAAGAQPARDLPRLHRHPLRAAAHLHAPPPRPPPRRAREAAGLPLGHSRRGDGPAPRPGSRADRE